MRKKRRGPPSAPPPSDPGISSPAPGNSVPANGVPAQGVLELHPKGYGFLRSPARNYAAQPSDPYVPAPMIQKLGLREGVLLAGPVEPAKKGGPRLLAVEQIEGAAP